MAVRIRLKRMGRKKRPFYRIVVMDSRTRRDGREIERLGYYNPLTREPEIQLDEERTLHWLRMGAQPTDTVKSILKKLGIALKFHLEKSGASDQTIEQELQKWQMYRDLKRKETEEKAEGVSAEVKEEKIDQPKPEEEQESSANESEEEGTASKGSSTNASE